MSDVATPQLVPDDHGALNNSQQRRSTMCTAGAGYAMFTPDSIDWIAAPPTLPAGVKVAVIEGNPLEAEAFTMRLLFPAGTRVEPHFHPAVEHGTVLSGVVYFGMGEAFAIERLRRMPVGSFFVIRPGLPHFGLVEEDTIIQAHGVGPWQTTYVTDPLPAWPLS